MELKRSVMRLSKDEMLIALLAMAIAQTERDPGPQRSMAT